MNEKDIGKIRECVGCGFCCIKSPCDASRRLYPGATRCPQLEWIDDKYRCGLMLIQGPVGAGYREELYAGAGCCSGLNSWRQNVIRRDPPDKKLNLENSLDKVFQIFLKSLSRQFISGDTITLTLADMEVSLERLGYSREKIENIYKLIILAFKNNQSSFMSEFMG